MNKNYKLLTPGPLTTTSTVKEEMLFDHCTWDEDYKRITQRIRRELLELAHCDSADYTTVLMQGSGTFGVESVLTSVIGRDDKVLLCTNGAYGDRQVKICEHAGIDYVQYAEPYDRIPDAAKVEERLAADPSITHVSMIHSETTSGLLNDIEAVAQVAKAQRGTAGAYGNPYSAPAGYTGGAAAALPPSDPWGQPQDKSASFGDFGKPESEPDF